MGSYTLGLCVSIIFSYIVTRCPSRTQKFKLCNFFIYSVQEKKYVLLNEKEQYFGGNTVNNHFVLLCLVRKKIKIVVMIFALTLYALEMTTTLSFL